MRRLATASPRPLHAALAATVLLFGGARVAAAGAQLPPAETADRPAPAEAAAGPGLADPPPRPAWTGPLRTREQFLLSVGFLSLEPADPAVLEEGRWRVDLVHTATNTWVGSEAFEPFLADRPRRQPVSLEELREVDGDDTALFLADGELYRTSVTLRRGLGGGFEAEVTVPWIEVDGGFGDAAIEAFHDGIGLEDGHRPAVPRDDFTIYLRDVAGNEVFRDEEPSPGIGDVTLGLKRRIGPGSRRWSAALQAAVKLATGDEETLLGSDSVDYGAQLLLARVGDHSDWFLALGATRLGESQVFSLDEQTVLSALVAYERRIRSGLSAIFQLQAAESPFQDLAVEELGDVAYLLDVGLKQRVGRDAVLFAAFSENIVHFLNSADFGLHFGLTWAP